MRLDWWERHGFAAACALLVLLTAVDAATGSRLVIITAFAAAPLFAAMFVDTRRTAVVAAGAILAGLAAGWWDDIAGEQDWAVRVTICAGLSIFAVVIAYTRQRREERLRRMTVIAETAQRAVLRAMPSTIGGIGFSARYVSASVEALIGGDLYEVAATPYGIRVIVGDVRGKGLDAVQLAASVLGGYRQVAFTTPSLTEVALTLDRTVDQVSGDEDFVTALLCEFDDNGRVTLVNCGHHPPLLTGPANAPRLLDTGPPVLPLGLGTQPRESEYFWRPGSRLLFYTDGLVEARNASGDFLPFSVPAQAVVAADLDAALDTLIAELLSHTGHRLADDMALVLAENRASG